MRQENDSFSANSVSIQKHHNVHGWKIVPTIRNQLQGSSLPLTCITFHTATALLAMDRSSLSQFWRIFP